MPNRNLNPEELKQANAVLVDLRSRLEQLAPGDHDLLFALRRKIYKELIYDERGKPTARHKLKLIKYDEQHGRCAICNESMPIKYSELDRFSAAAGYTRENTRLVHAACHRKSQQERGYK